MGSRGNSTKWMSSWYFATILDFFVTQTYKSENYVKSVISGNCNRSKTVVISNLLG